MWFVQPVLAWGAFVWRHAKPELIGFGVLGKSQAVKSSTMQRPARACQKVRSETELKRKS